MTPARSPLSGSSCKMPAETTPEIGALATKVERDLIIAFIQKEADWYHEQGKKGNHEMWCKGGALDNIAGRITRGDHYRPKAGGSEADIGPNSRNRPRPA